MSSSSVVVQALHLLAALSAVASGMAVKLEHLERRAAQTTAVCNIDYAWSYSAQGAKTPCNVAAELLAPCNGGNWFLPALNNPQDAYTNPNATTAGPCTCSWAVYNLLSACSDCQGRVQAVRTWPDYKTNCPAQYLSTTTFYPNEFIPDGVSIPFWATTNPTEWLSSQYNSGQARPIAQQGKPDITKETPKKKTSVGPIVGGVIGGLVVIAAAGGIAYYLLRRYKQQNKPKPPTIDNDPNAPGHNRNLSGATMTSVGYTTLASTSSPGPAHTIRTHVTSQAPFSVIGSPTYTTFQTPSPPPMQPMQPVVHSNPEDVIVPFSLQHQRMESLSSRDRKSPGGSIPVYDHPSAPPNRADDVFLATPERARVNPPAYTPTDNSPSGSSSGRPAPGRPTARRQHTANTSDADLSYTSYNFNNSSGMMHQHPAGVPAYQRDGSASSIITTPMDAASGVGGQTTYSQTQSSYPRDVKRPPTEESINTRDIG